MPLSTDPITWKLDENSDLHIDPVLGVTFVSGAEAVRQGVRTRLRLFMGEWFRNMDVGMPYHQELLGDNSKARDRDDRWKAAVLFQILDTPGIIEVISLKLDFESSTRTMTITWSARIQFDDTVPDVLSDTLEVPGA